MLIESGHPVPDRCNSIIPSCFGRAGLWLPLFRRRMIPKKCLAKCRKNSRRSLKLERKQGRTTLGTFFKQWHFSKGKLSLQLGNKIWLTVWLLKLSCLVSPPLTSNPGHCWCPTEMMRSARVKRSLRNSRHIFLRGGSLCWRIPKHWARLPVTTRGWSQLPRICLQWHFKEGWKAQHPWEPRTMA